MSPVRAPSYDYLGSLTDDIGVFEHAEYTNPRREHGYCVDDVARALVVAVRAPAPTPDLERVGSVSLGFLELAVVRDGNAHNRMSATGRWTDRPVMGDWWGRAVLGLGTAAVEAARPFDRSRAMYAFLRAAQQRPVDVRTAAFAAIGAARVLRSAPDAERARALLEASLSVIPSTPIAGWGWPEPRLRYANGALCEALIAGGAALGRDEVLSRGLELLDTLLRIETGDSGRLSVTGHAGRGPGERDPAWDQQPIEPAAIADACAAATEATADRRWDTGIRLARAWFDGGNDADVRMFDPTTGACFDGLTATGPNENCGAESTIAAVSTAQHASRLEDPR